MKVAKFVALGAVLCAFVLVLGSQTARVPFGSTVVLAASHDTDQNGKKQDETNRLLKGISKEQEEYYRLLAEQEAL